jgi:hypothetical protein
VAVDIAGPEAELAHPGRDYAWDHSTGNFQGNRLIRLMSASVWVSDRFRKKSDAQRNPEWLPDPSRRHSLRYWDGARWTRFVIERKRREE